jgi:hypothetical protein
MEHRYSRTGESPSARKLPNGYPGTENTLLSSNKYSPRAHGSITNKYLEALQPQTPARSNSQAFPNLGPPDTGSRSPSPVRRPVFNSKDDVSLMRSSSTVYFRTLATNSSPSADDPTAVYIPGVTDVTEDVAGMYSDSANCSSLICFTVSASQ